MSVFAISTNVDRLSSLREPEGLADLLLLTPQPGFEAECEDAGQKVLNPGFVGKRIQCIERFVCFGVRPVVLIRENNFAHCDNLVALIGANFPLCMGVLLGQGLARLAPVLQTRRGVDFFLADDTQIETDLVLLAHDTSFRFEVRLLSCEMQNPRLTFLC